MDKDQEEMWEKLKRRHYTLEEKLEIIKSVNSRLNNEQWNEMLEQIRELEKRYLKNDRRRIR